MLLIIGKVKSNYEKQQCVTATDWRDGQLLRRIRRFIAMSMPGLSRSTGQVRLVLAVCLGNGEPISATEEADYASPSRPAHCAFTCRRWPASLAPAATPAGSFLPGPVRRRGLQRPSWRGPHDCSGRR